MIRNISLYPSLWKAYQNVVQMLYIRGYKCDPKQYEIPFHDFVQKIQPICEKHNNNNNIDCDLLSPLTLCVNKNSLDINVNVDPFHLAPIDQVINEFLTTSSLMKKNALKKERLQQKKKEDEKKSCEYDDNDDNIIDFPSLSSDFLTLNESNQSNNRPTLELKLKEGDKENVLKIDQCLPNEVIVLFGYHSSQCFGIQTLKQIIHYQHIINNYHLILILFNHEKPKNFISNHTETQRLVQLTKTSHWKRNKGRRVEFFNLYNFMFNITESIFHNPITKLSPKETIKLLEKYKIKKEQLETILLDDPMQTYYDLKQGDMISVQTIDNHTNIMAVESK